MFQQNSKKKPPPRPPPPNFNKYKSKSTYNLTQTTQNLIEWSPPISPRPEQSRQFGGSISSSYSSSASSLASSKKSLENDLPPLFNLNFTQPPFNWASSSNSSNSNNVQIKEAAGAIPKPRIIRPPPKRNAKDSPDGSPPMPKVPPPSPPKEACAVVTPYGIALFDFPASQPGDLALQVDDVVVLLRRVNSEWLYGRVCDKEGMFPENFIQIEVPLPGEDQIVTALYEFNPQVQGDLALRPGQKVRVIKHISDDWLYGESNGQTGQFPRNFVS